MRSCCEKNVAEEEKTGNPAKQKDRHPNSRPPSDVIHHGHCCNSIFDNEFAASQCEQQSDSFTALNSHVVAEQYRYVAVASLIGPPPPRVV